MSLIRVHQAAGKLKHLYHHYLLTWIWICSSWTWKKQTSWRYQNPLLDCLYYYYISFIVTPLSALCWSVSLLTCTTSYLCQYWPPLLNQESLPCIPVWIYRQPHCHSNYLTRWHGSLYMPCRPLVPISRITGVRRRDETTCDSMTKYYARDLSAYQCEVKSAPLV